MSKITLNPDSVFSKSQGNFIVSKDTIYAFTKSVSALNDSIYGMQPTRDQLLSGFSISDIFEVNPLSTNGSLCANVYVLDENIGAIKFFASRPFVVCENEAERNELARNPLAIYLTPTQSQSADTSANSDSYEWIYILSSIEGASDWDVVVSAYNEWKLSGDEFHLTSFPGKWELIGTTSFTDEKISGLVNDVYTYVNDISGDTEEKILSVSKKIDSIDDSLSGYVPKQVSSLTKVNVGNELYFEVSSNSSRKPTIYLAPATPSNKYPIQFSAVEEPIYIACNGMLNQTALKIDGDAEGHDFYSEDGVFKSEASTLGGGYAALDSGGVGIRGPIFESSPTYEYSLYGIDSILYRNHKSTGSVEKSITLNFPKDEALSNASEPPHTLATREWVSAEIESIDFDTRLSNMLLSVDQISTAVDALSSVISSVPGDITSLRRDLDDEVRRATAKENTLSNSLTTLNDLLTAYATKNELSTALSNIVLSNYIQLSDFNNLSDEYDEKGAAANALTAANSYTDGKISETRTFVNQSIDGISADGDDYITATFSNRGTHVGATSTLTSAIDKVSSYSDNWDSAYAAIQTSSDNWNEATSKVNDSANDWDAAAAAIATSSDGWNNAAEKIDDIESEVNDLTGSTIPGIESDVGTLKTDYSALNSAVTRIDGEVATNTSDIETIQSSVGDLTGRVQTVESEVTTLNSGVDNIQTDITSLNATVTAINNAVTVLVELSDDYWARGGDESTCYANSAKLNDKLYVPTIEYDSTQSGNYHTIRLYDGTFERGYDASPWFIDDLTANYLSAYNALVKLNLSASSIHGLTSIVSSDGTPLTPRVVSWPVSYSSEIPQYNEATVFATNNINLTMPFNDLAYKIQNNASSISGIDTRLLSIEGGWQALTAAVQTNTIDIRYLTSGVNELGGRVTTIEGTLGDVGGTLNQLTGPNGAIDAINDMLSTQSDQISGLSNVIDGVQGTVGNVQQSIEDIMLSIGRLDSNINLSANSISDAIYGLTEDVYGLNQAIEISVSNLITDINQNTNDIGSLGLTVQELTGDVNDLTYDVSQLCSTAANLLTTVNGINDSYVSQWYLSQISGDLHAETESVSSQLTNIISNECLKKETVSTVIIEELSAFDDYATGAEIPTTISAIIEWSAAIHKALKSIAIL